MGRRITNLLLIGTILVVSNAMGAALVVAQDQDTTPPEGLRTYRPAVYALTGGTIIVSPARQIEDGVIVVRGEKIVAVGSADQVAIPADAHPIDCRGKTIYPGFIDSYTEQEVDGTRLQDARPYWNSYVRPQLSVADQLSIDTDENDSWRRQGVVARLVAPAGGIIRGESVIALTSDDDQDRALLSDLAALHIRLTVSRRFGGGDDGEERPSYPNSPMGAVALTRQAFYDAIWYRDAWAAVNADPQLTRPERNDALEAIQPYLAGEQLVMFDTLNELYSMRADRFAKEFSLNAVLLGSGNEYRRLDAVAGTNRPVIVPVNFPSPPDVSSEQIAASVSLESMMHWDHAPENPGRLAHAGVTIALTTNGLDSTDDFMEAVRQSVARGLDKQTALEALTVNPANLFGVSDLIGTIEEGKLACFVVSSGDVFDEDVTIDETWVRGLRYEHEPAREQDVAGYWELDIDFVSGKPNRLLIKVDGDSGDLSGEVMTALDEDAESGNLDTVTLSGTQIQGSFPAYFLDQEGVARFSAVLEITDDSWLGLGHMIWPDGTRVGVRIRPAEGPADADSTDIADASDDDSDEGEGAEVDPASSFPVTYPLGAYGVAGPPRPVARLLFRDATVWTCGPDGIIENGDVLIENGLIVEVGEDIRVDRSVPVIDARGMHLTPGIIDCHSHMASDSGINESGQAITAEVRIGDFIDCDDITIYRQLAGGVTSSNILHGSANPIGGQNQVIKLRWGHLDEAMKFADAPEGIKFALGENVKQSRSSDSTRYPRTRMGVDQIIRDEFHAGQRYLESWQAWRDNPSGVPPRRDLELEAIAEILAGERWVHCHSYRQDEILALIRTLDEFGITIGTFQHILEGYKVAEAMAEHGAMASAFSDWWAYKMEVYDAIPFAGALMHEAGIVVSFNSDDGELATHLNLEAAKAVKYGGVSPEEALKFVTLNPAKQLRIDQWVGSIEPGKHADLVLWSGSPLSNFSRCEQTWIDGARYFDRESDAAMREQVAEQRNVLIQKILSSGAEMRPRGMRDRDPSSLWPRFDEFCRAHGAAFQEETFDGTIVHRHRQIDRRDTSDVDSTNQSGNDQNGTDQQ